MSEDEMVRHNNYVLWCIPQAKTPGMSSLQERLR
jgi:hypothetical protein